MVLLAAGLCNLASAHPPLPADAENSAVSIEPGEVVADCGDWQAFCPTSCSPCFTVPNMLGEPGNGILYDIPNSSARRFKISDNDSILPQDRIFFTFSYFDDAFRYTDTVNPAFTRAADYRSYVVGYEKSLA